MNKNIRIYNRFKWWSVDDCLCEYCLYIGKNHLCSLEICCCDDIRQEAVRREQEATNGSQSRKGVDLCRG